MIYEPPPERERTRWFGLIVFVLTATLYMLVMPWVLWAYLAGPIR